jgi:anti-sigma regulatory factor (Ser/Thr protein kinase)
MFTSNTPSVAAPSVSAAVGAALGRGPAAGPRPWNTQQARMILAGHPENVRDTRCWLRAVMRGWAVSEESAESAVLLLSELVSNAVLHARNTCRVLVTARLRWGLLQCEVEDQDPSWRPGRTRRGAGEGGAPTNPGPVGGVAASLGGSRTPDTAVEEPAETGRGLPLLDALASTWGVRRHSRGNTVWFVLPTRDCPDASAAVTAKPSDSSADGCAPGLARRPA